MQTLVRVADRGSRDPITARLFIAILDLRDHAFSETEMDASGASLRTLFDQTYRPIWESLARARMSHETIVALLRKHEADLTAGTIVKRSDTQVRVTESIDDAVRNAFWSFVLSGTLALRDAQKVTRLCGVETGFLVGVGIPPKRRCRRISFMSTTASGGPIRLSFGR